MRRAAVVLLAAVALAAPACDEGRRFPTAADLDDIDLSVDHRLRVDEEGFTPDELDVAEGEVVEVTNAGEQVHTLTADEVDGAIAFDVRLEPGDVLTLVTPGPAEITFRDLEQPDHRGRMVVRPTGR
ncbi:MAG: hypothetical protein AB7L84_04470 [Acidimicrobiia bacterium]